MEWNVYVVGEPEDRTCVLSPLPRDLVLRLGLPAPAVAGELIDATEEVLSGAPGRIDREQFKPNSEFGRFLHWVLSKHAPRCPGVLQAAQHQPAGYVYIIDARTPTPAGEVPPDDVIGAVKLKDGAPAAYEPMPGYEPLGRNGLMVLDPWLEERFMDELVELARRGEHARSHRN